MSFRIDKGQVIPVRVDKETQRPQGKKIQDLKFQNMLQESMQRGQDIKISAHARQRMEERQIHLEEKDMKALQGAINDLEQKGAQESLILYKDHAFIASIRNRTIITTMGNDELEIVTNIDSAIAVK